MINGIDGNMLASTYSIPKNLQSISGGSIEIERIDYVTIINNVEENAAN